MNHAQAVAEAVGQLTLEGELELAELVQVLYAERIGAIIERDLMCERVSETTEALVRASDRERVLVRFVRETAESCDDVFTVLGAHELMEQLREMN